MNWIKTTDQLPPVGCYVLGYLGYLKEPKMLICKLDWEVVNGYGYYIFYGTQPLEDEYAEHYYPDQITHWTHLPNAPEVEG